MSQGEKQRLALAAILADEPKYLILDEPIKGLDMERQNILIQVLENLRNRGIGMTIITHNYAFINQIYYEESETVAMGRPLIELIDMQETTVMIYVNQSQLARFSIGDQMKVYIDGTDQIFSGTIIKINNKSEFTPKQILTPDNRTSFVYGIKILIDESNTELKDGMPVLVRRG